MKLKDFKGEIRLIDIKDVQLTKDIQSRLGIDADGIVGAQTIAAFERFKKEHYLGGRGLLGETTARKLATNIALVSAHLSNDAFNQALAFALRWEGGYSNHPNDTGGETNKGITWRVYNSYRYSEGLPVRSVRYLTQEEMQDIYMHRYWIPANCDNLPQAVAIAQFDWGVNSGVGRAQATLRQACGGMNLKQAIGAFNQTGLAKRYNDVREGYYRAWGRGSQVVFLSGWLNRLRALRSLVEG